MIKSAYWFSCKVTVIIVISYCNFNFRDGFSSNKTISNFMEILSVGADLFMDKMKSRQKIKEI